VLFYRTTGLRAHEPIAPRSRGGRSLLLSAGSTASCPNQAIRDTCQRRRRRTLRLRGRMNTIPSVLCWSWGSSLLRRIAEAAASDAPAQQPFRVEELINGSSYSRTNKFFCAVGRPTLPRPGDFRATNLHFETSLVVGAVRSSLAAR